MKSKIIQSVIALVLTFGTFSFTNAATSTVQVTSTFVQPASVVYKTPVVVLPATSTVVVTGTGATTTCVNLLTSYSKLGTENSDVAKLQNFLNANFNTKLNGKGYFGPVTKAVVQDFQYTYGINPTGYQYISTTEMINKINCGVVPVKALKNFTETKNLTVSNSSASSLIPQNIIPSPVSAKPLSNTQPTKNIVKDYTQPTKVQNNNKIPAVEGKPSDTTISASTTKMSFWDNLKKDWAKIKENYKAYLLVFALVLALFWFLRKAATE